MTREEAIGVIKSECYVFNPLNLDRSTMINTALDMAIQAMEQEPCEDAVSRQAAIDALGEKPLSWTEGEYEFGLQNQWQSDVDAIKALPSVIPTHKEERWIPCSERLPEDRREVLVTAYWHETYQVMIGSYFGDGLWWCVPFNNSGEHMQKLKPKAWMPLPEQYKE